MNNIYVMFGGAIGSLARYQFGRMATHIWGAALPFGTLGVNLIGGLLMGLLVGSLARFGTGGESLRLLIGVGLLGGFTTFSAFSLDVVTLMERGQYGVALGYALLSVAGSVAALFAGLMLMRGVMA
ncbi:MAG: fluoride efflux transporter CrcB [Sphingobium sp.]|nr:fluoride efflux transporter CrcB [Sphingobium sp.]